MLLSQPVGPFERLSKEPPKTPAPHRDTDGEYQFQEKVQRQLRQRTFERDGELVAIVNLTETGRSEKEKKKYAMQ